MAKARESIVWYQNEAKEYTAKLQHLEQLKELELSAQDESEELPQERE